MASKSEELQESLVRTTRKARVYVAGPITLGNQGRNVREAIRISDEVYKLGYIPYCPHLTYFWDMIYPHEHQTWMNMDKEWLRECDILLRLPGKSKGADMEVAWAGALGIPVIFKRELEEYDIPPQLVNHPFREGIDC